jgi:uncharacterized C2H2 Zn-finger protein
MQYPCGECGLYFQKVKEFRAHLKDVHSTGISSKPVIRRFRKVECSTCGRTLNHNSMNLHRWTHFSEDEKKEWLASGNRNPEDPIRKLKQAKMEAGGFPCKSCSKVFPLPSYLKFHEKSHIAREDRPKLVCEICGKVFTTRHGLRYHTRTVHDPEQLHGKWKTCKICDRKFTLLAHLKSHMMQHLGGEKSNVCEKCGKAFISKKGLTSHAFVHLSLGERPFQCQYCPINYRHPKNLKRHVQRDHKDKLQLPQNPEIWNTEEAKPIELTCKQMYPCPVCDKPFPLPSRLTKHFKISGHGVDPVVKTQ